MSSESREHRNTYPDYDGSDPILDPLTGQLKEEIKTPLYDHIKVLLRNLEDRLVTGTDWNDFSVYTGTAGLALLYMHFMDSRTPLKDLHPPIKCLAYIEPSVPHLKKKRFSFLCGVAGPLAVGSVLYKKVGKERLSKDLAQRLENLEREATIGSGDMPDELLYGRAGYLFSLLFLQKYLDRDEYRDKIISQVVASVVKSGKHWAKKFKNTMNFPLYYEWHDKAYVGAAHGFAGIFYVLLQAKEFLSFEDMTHFVKPSIDLVLSLQFPSGNFPSSLGNSTDKLIHWCHGAPGIIHLMLLAYETFSEDKYLESARRCSEVIWERGLLKKGYSLCHGVAGNGYAFLRMYQVTKEKKYLHRALKFGEWCYEYGSRCMHTPDHPLSLFEGLAGTVYFLSDLLDPDNAAFPAFEL